MCARRKSAYSPDEYEEKLLREYRRRFSSSSHLPFDNLEDLITSTDGFGLVTATKMQRAIWRIIDGRPLDDLRDWHELEVALGCSGRHLEDVLDGQTPEEIVLTAGVRGGKTLTASGHALMATQLCSFDHLGDGEIPRYTVTSLSKDNASVLLQHLRGALQRPKLRPLVIDNPGERWKEILEDLDKSVVGHIFLWSPSGRPTEIRVVAGKRLGGSAISRWSLGQTLDEAPRMVGAADGVINYDDQKSGVETRLLVGAQHLSIGSPGPPYGPVFDIVQREWGNPSADRVVIKTTGPMLNPSYWTPERCAKIQRKNPNLYTTDILGNFADAAQTLFPQEVIQKKMRRDLTGANLPYQERHIYQAAMDPATRRNAWTVVVADRVGKKKRIVYRRQWQGTSEAPLVTSIVLREIKADLAKYKLNRIRSDQWAVDSMMSEAFTIGLIVEQLEMAIGEMNKQIVNLSREADMGYIETPYDTDLEKDFKLARGRPKMMGQAVQLPETSDGRHCDFVPCTALAMYGWLDDVVEMPIGKGTPEAEDKWEREQIEKETAALSKSKGLDKWQGSEGSL